VTEPVGWDDLTDDLRERIADHDDRLDTLETQVHFYVAREKGIRMVLGGTVGAVGFIATVLAVAKYVGVI